ncbi:integrin alpha-7 isoform X1 [Eublepharis macularius]|uniref:Integrin alpha-7 isoform X1 n=1 Tax=Eublepharis macularius TaxID=481883 RepID=A0AA97KLM0_EUBMA|nr:integrin alpha-7 isoform X1 [Eublepharis macularius]
MPGALYCGVFCLGLCLLESSAFNLDVAETVLKYGDNGSFFGFSVALHQQLQPQPVSWLLVGAPQAAALPGQRANRTGGLYACPLTHEINDCKRVSIDEGVDLKKESKENQWLGVSVKSQGPGGKIVTCAHLYEARNRVNESLETRDVIGRCYVLSEGLKVSDELDGGEWKFCEGRPQGHDRFGFCQQGVATGFTADRHYILFGAPGTYNWKGTLRAELSGLDLSHYDDGPYEAGGEKDQDPSLIPLPANSYLGFSLDSGVGIIKKDELSFVTGAPRANHTGAVVILQRDNVNRLVPEFILWGEKLTSSFGYSLAVVDLNGDGWMDLVVGAPNLFDRKEGIGGAVYVYVNQAGDWGSVHPTRLNGSYDSMFGITVGAVGDLNQDSFQDFAVGAPLDGDGKVYIYHGSNSGFAIKPAQVLTGESVGVKMFGYSFSGGLDIDGNLYPDLLVGSLSDTVVLYRTRPVIHISRTVTVSPQNIDLENMNCRHQVGICMDVKVCFSYTANPPSYSPPIMLEYTFDADTDRRQSGQTSRVTFLGWKTTDPEHQYSGVVELPAQHARVCARATLQVKDKIRDKLRPIVVVVSYNIKHPRTKRQAQGATLGPLLPVLNPMPPRTQKTEVNFLKQGCGEDKICQSNLQLSYRFCSRIDDATFHPLPRDSNGLDKFSMSDQKVIALEIHVTNYPSDAAEPQRDGDDAHEATLLVVLPSTLLYSALRPYNATEKAPPCIVSNQNASLVECELGNPMKRGAQIRFYLVLGTSGITLETTELEVQLELSTISEQLGLAPVVARALVVMELPLSIAGIAEPQQLFFSGQVRGESAMRRESEVGSPVSYRVTVSNRGQSLNTLGSAFLNVLWPHEIANGKWLLYPLRMELELSTQPQRPTTCSPVPNTLHLTLEPPHQQGRRKRETEQGGSPRQPRTYWERRKNVTLDCDLGTAHCQHFQCPLYSFDRSAVLTIWGRLWNSTFLEEYSAVTSVDVIVRASITVKSTIKNLFLKDSTTQIPVTVYLDPSVAVARGVPWWIILIAILAGILVLGLLVSILWKLGFFKRTRYEEAKVPQYHAVKIPRQERQLFREEKTGTISKKDWITHWNGDSDGHVPASA